VETIVATRALALTMSCPECMAESGPCVAEKTGRAIEAIHRARLHAAAARIDDQQ
jgi:hypothetical protein